MSGDVSIMSYADYVEVKQKSAESSLPDGVYCDYANPLATLHFTPVPSQNCIVTIWSEKPHAKPNTLYDLIEFPDEFINMLKFNLAVAVAGEFGVEASPEVRRIAEASLAGISKNTRRQITEQP